MSPMEPPTLNKLHRRVGIIIAPCLVIQTLSGLLLSFGVFREGGRTVKLRHFLESRGNWNGVLVNTHFGPGLLSDAYHLLLVGGIIWMAVSGWMLYLRGRRARQRGAATGEGAAQADGEDRGTKEGTTAGNQAGTK